MPKRKKKDLKKKVEAFWKKKPELKSIADHLGKFIDRIDPNKLRELAMYGGVGYMGYKAFGNTWEGALLGMVGLKLATVPAGEGTSLGIWSPIFAVDIPMNSQVVGLSILGTIGLIDLVLPALSGTPSEKWRKRAEAVERPGLPEEVPLVRYHPRVR